MRVPSGAPPLRAECRLPGRRGSVRRVWPPGDVGEARRGFSSSAPPRVLKLLRIRLIARECPASGGEVRGVLGPDENVSWSLCCMGVESPWEAPPRFRRSILM